MARMKRFLPGLPVLLSVIIVLVYYSMQGYLMSRMPCCGAFNRLSEVVTTVAWLLLTALSAVCAVQIKPHWGKFVYLTLNSAVVGGILLWGMPRFI